MRAGGTAVTAPHAGRAGSPFLGRAASAPAPLPPHGGAGAASPSSSPFLPSPPPSPPSPFPAARSQPGTRIAGSEAGGRHPSSLPLPPFAFFCPPHPIPLSHEAPDPPPGAVCAGGALDRRSPPPLLRGEEEVGGGGTREPNAGGKGAPGAAGIPPSLSSCVESLAPCPRSGSLLRRGTDALSRRRSPLCRCRTRLRCRDGAHRLPRRGTSGHRAERERPPGWAAPRPPGSRASTASAVLVVVLRLLLLFPFVIVVSVCTGCDLRSEGERQRPRLSISALSRCRVAVRTSRRSDGAGERHGASNPTRRGKARSSAARAAREAGRLQGSRGAALMAASWPGRARG